MQGGADSVLPFNNMTTLEMLYQKGDTPEGHGGTMSYTAQEQLLVLVVFTATIYTNFRCVGTITTTGKVKYGNTKIDQSTTSATVKNDFCVIELEENQNITYNVYHAGTQSDARTFYAFSVLKLN